MRLSGVILQVLHDDTLQLTSRNFSAWNTNWFKTAELRFGDEINCVGNPHYVEETQGTELLQHLS